MRCFNHHDKDAIGTCKSCARGLCPDCAVEVEKAIACRDRCEGDVATIRKLNSNALQFARSTKQARYLAPVMFIFIGALLTTMGFSFEGVEFAKITGVVIILIGVAFLVIQHRLGRGMKT